MIVQLQTSRRFVSSCQAVVCGEPVCLPRVRHGQVEEAEQGLAGWRMLTLWRQRSRSSISWCEIMRKHPRWAIGDPQTFPRASFVFLDIAKTFTCLPFIPCMFLKHQSIRFSNTRFIYVHPRNFFSTGGPPLGSAVRSSVLHRAQPSY